RVDCLADQSTAGVVFLADRLEKPVLVEGPAGVGKTELAKAIAAATGARLIRLQCYEGLDEAKALYEWNYKKQLLRIQADREHETSWADVESDIFSEPFLLTRPLLEAVRSEDPVVLLIDEVDRVEIETEALLLEVPSDFLGAHAPVPGSTRGRRRRHRRHAPRTAQVPVRHRQGPQGAATSRRVPAVVTAVEAGDRLLDVVQGFVHELRAAGLPVSTTENLD